MSTNNKFEKFKGNLPAGNLAIKSFEDNAGCTLPLDYVQFLKKWNGGEGFIGKNNYLMLWPVEDILLFNKEYEVYKYCPGLLFFGSNGGGGAFAFDMRSKPWTVVQVPFIGMAYDTIEVLGITFVDFLNNLE